MASITGPLGPNNSALVANSASAKTKAGKKTKATEVGAKQPVDSASLSAADTAAVKSAVPSPVEGAKEIPGLFKILRKGGKVWFSIAPEQLNKPFFFGRILARF